MCCFYFQAVKIWETASRYEVSRSSKVLTLSLPPTRHAVHLVGQDIEEGAAIMKEVVAWVANRPGYIIEEGVPGPECGMVSEDVSRGLCFLGWEESEAAAVLSMAQDADLQASLSPDAQKYRVALAPPQRTHVRCMAGGIGFRASCHGAFGSPLRFDLGLSPLQTARKGREHRGIPS